MSFLTNQDASTVASNLCIVASFALLLWDTILCFFEETELFILSGHITLPKCLFYMARYGSLIEAFVTVFLSTYDVNTKACLHTMKKQSTCIVATRFLIAPLIIRTIGISGVGSFTSRFASETLFSDKSTDVCWFLRMTHNITKLTVIHSKVTYCPPRVAFHVVEGQYKLLDRQWKSHDNSLDKGVGHLPKLNTILFCQAVKELRTFGRDSSVEDEPTSAFETPVDSKLGSGTVESMGDTSIKWTPANIGVGDYFGGSIPSVPPAHHESRDRLCFTDNFDPQKWCYEETGQTVMIPVCNVLGAATEGAGRTGAKEVDVYGDARYRSKDEVRLQIWTERSWDGSRMTRSDGRSVSSKITYAVPRRKESTQSDVIARARQ
ncbi:uncharacterized protein STEHIDRAFT_116452 [Stereum hirsutum FP-91666 SS1]|uniref:DUF6533 domain-containing protein n=1 Tax=Stereum hirsutum (strain FP-91666) TaxID=721885 RepID=R7RW91_STEHR|nr:uncharacterized protein STEHIDRAFT_116452 [Stereum hirsutum FP-91666 SS1]EIM79549.1 hypothetical protein STEHIDRAFT_116452 [Stereum hirsutum FP-91666 SS1]